MAKLKQKQWLTLREAAEFVSNLTDGPRVKPSDIIQYALESEIVLSIRIVAPTSEPIYGAELVPFDELSKEERNTHYERERKAYSEEQMVMSSIIDGKIYFGNDVVRADLGPGIYDINKDGSPCRFLIRTWDRIRRGDLDDESLEAEPPHLVELEDRTVKFGPFIELNHMNSVIHQLPTYLIPPGSLLMVRSDRLQDLFEDEPQPTAKSEISTKEKKTYLKVIKTLCENHKDIDLGRHSTAASQLIALADSLALSIPGKRTLEILLKEARDLED